MRSRAELNLRLVFGVLIATGCLQVCGCHKTVMVFGPSVLPAALAPNATESDKAEAAKKELPGIPFYNHYGVCAKETLWLEPQTTLSLTVTPRWRHARDADNYAEQQGVSRLELGCT